MAEVLADVLRDRILSGDLDDGALLPKQDDLLAEFGTSKASAREAFRILETEGLVTVLRGNVGGAVVHRPKPETAAYMLGLVLQSKRVELSDVGAALQYVEPLCAALCAGREDRATQVVPQLEAAHQALVDAINDGDEAQAVPASRAFHEELVKRSGNETMILLAGALESLWSAHEGAWSVAASEAGRFPEPLLRKRALQEHEQLIDAIAAGDIDRATRTARRHLTTAQQYPLGDGSGGAVQASYLRRIP
ncbi:MAG: pdhR 1 [Frankiales bacterium]|nr:pdhR 1 [Frankiales bacterium]